MSVTIQEVAEAAGVSKATVSKVLHKSYSISQETCDRVNAVIKELGYQPNRRAQSFATGATKTILFLAEIPEDMAVITFDDFPFSKIIEPQLSVVNLDMYDMGEQAAKVVLRRIRTPQYLVQSQTTLPILIERQSTKKLP